MNSPNHVTGGTVFTGIFASFWDINIFSDFNILCVVWFASLLPDIDHTRSPIGKLFYPIAKYLDRKYGHRTITHSLLFLIITTVIFNSFSPFKFTLAFVLGLLSHFIFDMVTVQGIPLFYPFFKNPCVMPASPEARIRSGNSRSELVAFALFIFCGIFCYPLMANGFWMTFNRTLGTAKQLVSEFKRSDKMLQVDYAFRREFNTYTGSALCLSAAEGKIVLFNDSTDLFIEISGLDVVKSFAPTFTEYTDIDQITDTYSFSSYSPFQLDSLINGRAIYEISLFASSPLEIVFGHNSKSGVKFYEKYVNSLHLTYSQPNMTAQNEIYLIDLRTLKKEYQSEINKYNTDLAQKSTLQKEYKLASDYKKFKLKKLLTKIKPTPPKHQYFKSQIAKKQIKISELNSNNTAIDLFGTIKIMTL